MRNKLNKRHVIFFAVICCFIILCQTLDIYCPLRYFTAVPCPTCGVTRAMISLFKADLNGYLKYHPLALPLLLTVIAMIHIKHLKHKQGVLIFCGTVLTLNLILYAIRLFEILQTSGI